MRFSRFAFLMSCLAAGAPPVAAADLTKVPRAISREPALPSGGRQTRCTHGSVRGSALLLSSTYGPECNLIHYQ